MAVLDGNGRQRLDLRFDLRIYSSALDHKPAADLSSGLALFAMVIRVGVEDGIVERPEEAEDESRARLGGGVGRWLGRQLLAASWTSPA
jgi:hypothetical protein